MKNPILLLAFATITLVSNAQIGIGTTSPNTTLDVRGSLAINTRSFSTTSESVLTTDYALLFTGISDGTVTLPTAVGCTGRIIHIKNTKTSSVPVLTIATTASQTIDGTAITWLLDDPNESVNLVSDGANWKIMGQSLPAGSGTSWTQGGNTVTSEKKLGTIDGFGLPFITAGTERMRITNTGNIGIGTSSFNSTYPERLIVDAGTPGTAGNYQNVIVGKGNTNSYAQLNIQNTNAGTAASSDVVATANNGTETIHYIDVGINSGSNTSTGVLGSANTAYLYSTGNDLAIGNGTALKPIKFFTNDGGYTEQMRITGDGNVGIGSSSFDNIAPEKLLIDATQSGTYNIIGAYGERNGYVQFNIQNLSSGGQASTDIVATADNGTETTNYVDLGINSSNYSSAGSTLLSGPNNAYLYSKGEDFVIGNASTSKSIIFFTGGEATTNEKFRINSSGVVIKSNVLPSSDGNYDLGNSTTKWRNIYSTNTLNVSDARLKTNIRNLNYGLSDIMKMRSVEYNWKESSDKDRKIGFLAQELRNVIPEAVVGNEEKEHLAVNYIELIPVLVNAIKEQQQQIEQLKKKVKALENK
jgi:hypothetical protein